ATRHDVPALDRAIDEGNLSERQETLPSSLRTPLFHKGKSEDVQSTTPADSKVSPLRKGHKGLWRTSKVSEPVGAQSNRFLGGHRSSAASEIQVAMAHQR